MGTLPLQSRGAMSAGCTHVGLGRGGQEDPYQEFKPWWGTLVSPPEVPHCAGGEEQE